jgi:flagellar FliL protein
MFDLIQNPIVIAVVVLALIILIAISVVMRRRRAAQEDVLPPPELGQSVDYTSLPYEEPQTLGERLREAPIGVKLLLALVPLALIIGAVVLYLTFFAGDGTATVATPAPPAPAITNAQATLAGPTRIAIEADTTLPDGATITATMKDAGEDLAWFNPATASGQVESGRVRMVLEKAAGAPQPKRGQDQTVTLVTTVNDQVVSSEPAKLEIPSIYAAQFYNETTATAPTAAPTIAPTAASTAAPAAQPTAAPAPQASAVTTATTALKATVFNGGNIRKQPVVEACNNCPQLHAGDTIDLLERNESGTWYRVKAPAGEGWVSATLLTIDANVAKQVPTSKPATTGLTAEVFNGGNVRERPVTGKPLDQINAKETVQLLEKTSDGAWYRITNQRGVTGWVSTTLLRIPADIARQVPVAK